jgi:hypothetical protein
MLGTHTPENSGANRRQFPRIEEPPLHVSGVWATVDDVSCGGVCLKVPQPVARGSRLPLILTDAHMYFSQEVEAEVMWCSGPRAGLRFVNLTDDQQEWIEQRLLAWERDGGARRPQAGEETIRWGW